MSFDELLGHTATLKITRFATSGAYLSVEESDDRDVVLLIGSEIPVGAKVGDEVEVFLHLDSEGRPIATTRHATLELGEVGFLTVTSCTPIGAFVDWGLAKELLVPFKEQTTEMRAGERYAIGVYIDETGRLAGTMRVSEMLKGDVRDVTLDEWVEGEAWRNEPTIGVFVIVEKSFVALLPKSEPHMLSRGEAGRFRVANILADGKIELSMRGHAHEELAADAARIVAVLEREGADAQYSDKTDPDEIREVFDLSKKAWKRAVGTLLRAGKVTWSADGYLAIKR
jgi:predicted RNA-binding protein (virulence factor B family)